MAGTGLMWPTIDKWLCLECRFIGSTDDFEQVKDPGSDDIWSVCPKCRTPEQVVAACDEPGCTKESTCGFLTDTGGYRRTCFEHSTFMRRPKPHQAGPPT